MVVWANGMTCNEMVAVFRCECISVIAASWYVRNLVTYRRRYIPRKLTLVEPML